MWPHLVNVFYAFRALTTCRPISMGEPGRIPWTAIRKYGETHEVGDLDRFEQLIMRMDEAWMRTRHGEHERKENSSTTDDRGNRRG